MRERLQQLVGSDQALLVDVDARLTDALAGWLRPAPIGEGQDVRRAQAHVYVHEAPLFGVEAPRTAPALRLGSVGVWLRHEYGRAVLGTGEADCAGAVDLDARQATVVTNGMAGTQPRLHSMLTLAVGLVFGAMGRALVRGAVVAHPDGGAWLLVGEEGQGTTATLVRLTGAGWDYLAVEQAILQRARGNGLVVEGWPGASAAEAHLAGERRHGLAVLDGVLTVRQVPREDTSLRPRGDLDALTALLPTSPWLRLGPNGEATGIPRALLQGVRQPVFELRLGLDSYASEDRLVEILAGLPGAAV